MDENEKIDAPQSPESDEKQAEGVPTPETTEKNERIIMPRRGSRFIPQYRRPRTR